LDEIVREGAQRMLQAAIEKEVEEFLQEHAQRRDEEGRRLVVGNGHLPSRGVLTGAGNLEVRQPRARDNTPDPAERVQFSSKILPPYLRRSKSIDDLIPWLYLKGISTGDFAEALQTLVGEDAKGLSPNVIVRLKEHWCQEYEAWSRRDLSGKQYVYVWADGIYANIRLEDEENRRQCMLVLMGATAEGRKELIAVVDGYRESEQSWYELLVELRQRGLKFAPRLAVGDGALGFWAALRKVFPETRKQAYRAFDAFLERYGPKYSSACECLKKDREALLAFYDFPAEHWKHLRTTNPIESAFATIRLRHRKTKGNGTRRASLAMMFKLAQSAQKRWRRLNGHEQMPHLLRGEKFVDGVRQAAA